MILHSIVSPADIFCNMDTRFQKPVYRRIDGGLLEIENGAVKRLISTDPRLYLDSRYFPRNR
ncbi:MAG: hypothetical protein IK093_12975 [Ruminiclostridium sp.]|nr:hypothetical protein [Ruminiclostridium sp.]